MSELLNTFTCVELVEQSGLPRKALRALLVGNGLGPGSRVLVVGGASEDLLRCLDGLGLLVSGFEADPIQLATLRRKNALVDWRGGGPRETAFLPDHSFDLILVRQHPAYAGPIATADALRTTADLLAALRPGGTLAFLEQLGDAGAFTALPHRETCFTQHLSAYTGTVHAEVYCDSSTRSRLLKSPPSGPAFWVAQLTIPQTISARANWKRQLETALQSASGVCCADAARHTQDLRTAA